MAAAILNSLGKVILSEEKEVPPVETIWKLRLVAASRIVDEKE